MPPHVPLPKDVIIRSAMETDLPTADRIIRVAFGTAVGVPEPELFFGDADLVQNRWKAEGTVILVAESGKELAASVVVTRWGSFGFFGPFGVRPNLWDRGIAKAMVASVMDCFDQWKVRLAGLFTFPGSPKHIGLYQHFGFKPHYLTSVMTKQLPPLPIHENTRKVVTYAGLSPEEKAGCLKECRQLTDSIFEGLDVTAEIEVIEANGLGDTLLLRDRSRLTGFAACHLGPGTEAGSDACYVKFAAALGDGADPNRFENLLTLCEAYARAKGVSKLVAGVNTSRREAYEMMIGRGFRADILGVAMVKPDTAGFNRPGVFVMDDWR